MRGEAAAPSADFLTGGGAMGALIRAHDWAANPLGPPEAWPPSLQTAVGLVLGSRFPACLVWGPRLITIHNDALRPILGAKPEALGRPFSEVWGEAWETIGPIAERALAGKATFIEDFPLTIERNGYPEEAFFTFCYSPVRDETGRVAGFLDTVVETTGKVLTERRQAFLLRLEERLRGLADPREITLTAAAALGRHLGAARAGYGEIDAAGGTVAVERDWSDGTVASLAGEARLLDAFGPAVIAELRAGRTLVVEDCLTDPRSAGEAHAVTWAGIGTRSLVVVPLLGAGRLIAILYVHEPGPRPWRTADVTLAEDTARRISAAVERARTEAELRSAHARLTEILESLSDAFYAVDRDWRFTYVNKRAEERWGRRRDSLLGRVVWDVFRQMAGLQAEEALRLAMRERRPIRVELVSAIVGRWVEMDIHPTATGGLSVYLRDIAERKRAEERQALLAREVDHRAKNALAVVQAMMRLTRAEDVPSFARAVEGRIAALARAQTLLAEGRWDGADLRSMLEGELAPFLGGQRAELDGPPVVLPPGTAQPLAMAVHELATNAAKHGSLSVREGRVSVSWCLEGGAAGVLRLRWAEAGGPPIAGRPARRGFGSRVLEGTLHGQLGGAVTLAWEPMGLVCEMEVPLERHPARAGATAPSATSVEALPAPKRDRSLTDASATTAIHIPRADLALLRRVAVERANRNGGRPSVSDVIREMVERHRAELEAEARG